METDGRYTILRTWRYDRDPEGEQCHIVVTRDEHFIFEVACCDTLADAQRWVAEREEG